MRARLLGIAGPGIGIGRLFATIGDTLPARSAMRMPALFAPASIWATELSELCQVTIGRGEPSLGDVLPIMSWSGKASPAWRTQG